MSWWHFVFNGEKTLSLSFLIFKFLGPRSLALHWCGLVPWSGASGSTCPWDGDGGLGRAGIAAPWLCPVAGGFAHHSIVM